MQEYLLGEPFSAFVSVEHAIIIDNYDDMLREILPVTKNHVWDITHIFKTSGRFHIKSYRQEELEEMVKNCGTCITISKNIK